ncbi:MAG TPA: hypothetical protein VIY08_02055 [Candidatus Nitrosocosmicus sp.]
MPSENMIFCKNCDDQSDNNINNFYKDFVFNQKKGLDNTPKYLKIFDGTGKIITGIILF